MVMMGILLALQWDNWNDGKIEQRILALHAMIDRELDKG